MTPLHTSVTFDAVAAVLFASSGARSTPPAPPLFDACSAQPLTVSEGLRCSATSLAEAPRPCWKGPSSERPMEVSRILTSRTLGAPTAYIGNSARLWRVSELEGALFGLRSLLCAAPLPITPRRLYYCADGNNVSSARNQQVAKLEVLQGHQRHVYIFPASSPHLQNMNA